MYNLHYHIYRLPQLEIHKRGWYTFCLLNSGDSASLLLLDSTSATLPRGLDNGLVFSIQEDQLPKQVQDNIKNYPLFYQEGHGPFPLGTLQQGDICCLFDKIGQLITTTYIYKDYLLANFALQLLHFGIKNFVEVKTV